MKRICYHDTDPDGFSAAAVLLHKYPEMEFIPCNHESSNDPKTIEGYDEVYVVDTSGSKTWMEHLKNNNKAFFWIDHHESPINSLPKYEGLQQTDRSAAYLTWKFCFPQTKVHPVIEHVSDFDIWTFKIEHTKEFMLYLDTLLIPGQEIQIIEQLLSKSNEDMQDTYTHSQNLMIFLDKQLANDIKLNSKGTFEGIPCRYFFYGGKYRSRFAQMASDTFTDVDLIVMISILDNNSKRQYKYSLRSRTPEIDCGTLSGKHEGGGGHRQAAGFITDKLILE